MTKLFKICLSVFVPVLALLLGANAFAGHPGDVSSHEMRVQIDPNGRVISGMDRLAFKPDKSGKLVLYASSNVTIGSVKIDNTGEAAQFSVEPAGPQGLNRILVNLSQSQSGAGALLIEFSGAFQGVETASAGIERGVSYSGDAVMDEGKVFLPSSAFWHPRGDGLESYDITLSLPPGLDAASEGARLERREENGRSIVRYKTTRPVDGLNVVAGRFFVVNERYKGVELYTFFFDDDPALSKTYMDSVKGYIDLYEGLLPPYPYEKFAVVENFLPTGYGMPSFTLLGSRVLRLPFIPATSLGHEFVHNWWGNSVYVDPLYGNWAEALATYTADHLYLEKDNGGREYRKRSLVEFANYWGREEMTLKDFKYESSTAARVVGYNKGAFVFHMLRRMTGDEAFYGILSDFYDKYSFNFATWADIQKAFEAETGKNLGRFFGQWLTWSGAPVFDKESFFSDVTLEEKDGLYRVSFSVRMPDKEYMLDLPVVFKTASSETRLVETIVRDGQRVVVTLAERPLYVEIDPDYDVFRVLTAEETPATLSSFFGRDDGLIVLVDKSFEAVAKGLAEEYELRVVEAKELTRSARRKKPLLVLGLPTDEALRKVIDDNLPQEASFIVDEGRYEISGESYLLSDTVVALAMKDKERPGRPICLIVGNGENEAARRVAARLPHLASKGYVVFKKDGSTRHGAFEGKKVLRYEF